MPADPPAVTPESLEFCHRGEWGEACCPCCSATPKGTHQPDCQWQSFGLRSFVAAGVNRLLRPLAGGTDG